MSEEQVEAIVGEIRARQFREVGDYMVKVPTEEECAKAKQFLHETFAPKPVPAGWPTPMVEDDTMTTEPNQSGGRADELAGGVGQVPVYPKMLHFDIVLLLARLALDSDNSEIVYARAVQQVERLRDYLENSDREQANKLSRCLESARKARAGELEPLHIQEAER